MIKLSDEINTFVQKLRICPSCGKNKGYTVLNGKIYFKCDKSYTCQYKAILSTDYPIRVLETHFIMGDIFVELRAYKNNRHYCLFDRSNNFTDMAIRVPYIKPLNWQ